MLGSPGRGRRKVEEDRVREERAGTVWENGRSH